MTGGISAEYRKTVCTLAQWCGHFTLDTCISSGARQEEQYRPILNGAIWPLVRACHECWMYNPPRPALDRFGEILKPHGRKYAPAVQEACHMKWWQFWTGSRGTLLALIEYDPLLLQRVFRNLFDPMILGNLSSILDRSAIRFAKSQTPAKGMFALGLQRNVGLQYPTFFASETTTRELIEQAFETARFTETYTTWAQGPRPPLREEIKTNFPWLLDRLKNERHEDT